MSTPPPNQRDIGTVIGSAGTGAASIGITRTVDRINVGSTSRSSTAPTLSGPFVGADLDGPSTPAAPAGASMEVTVTAGSGLASGGAGTITLPPGLWAVGLIVHAPGMNPVTDLPVVTVGTIGNAYIVQGVADEALSLLGGGQILASDGSPLPVGATVLPTPGQTPTSTLDINGALTAYLLAPLSF